jgi:hypothetical protein
MAKAAKKKATRKYNPPLKVNASFEELMKFAATTPKKKKK